MLVYYCRLHNHSSFFFGKVVENSFKHDISYSNDINTNQKDSHLRSILFESKMSRNNYSIRDRNRRETSNEVQENRANLANATGAANASSVIYLGNIPNDWDEQVISSVVAGSGKIVDIRSRLDNSGRTKNFCFVEYLNPHEAARALTLLNEIKLGPKRKLRVELSKEGLRTSHPKDRPILQLHRNHLPYYVQMPAAMRENSTDSLPTEFPNSAAPAYSNNIGTAPIKQEITMPEVLAKASQYLPQFNPSAFKADDKISQNLQSIPPVQLIELLSTLKQLISTNVSSAQQVFDMSPNISIAVVQAMILMGLIDINTLTTAIRQQIGTPQPFTHTPTPPVAQISTPQPDPRWPHLSASAGQKLAKLDPNEATMIAQVLSLSQNDLNNLPPQQRQMVDTIRAQYA